MNLLYLPAAIPVGFFKVRVIISCCIFMFSLLFLAKPTVLLQINVFCGSRAEVVLRPIFCYLTLSGVYWNLELNFAKFLRPGLFGSRAEVVLRANFCCLTLSSVY